MKIFISTIVAILLVSVIVSQAQIDKKKILAGSNTTNTTIVASEDTYISKPYARKIFGNAASILLQNNPDSETRGLVRYVVSQLPANAYVNNATLYFYVSNGSIAGGATDSAGFVSTVNGNWNSSTVTWNNAPTVGNRIQTLYPTDTAIAGRWRFADVTSIIKGNGTFNFYIQQHLMTFSMLHSSRPYDQQEKPTRSPM